MLVHGQVGAGVDFRSLRGSDIRVDGKTVHVHLPSPKVLMTRLDNSKTRVYSRDTGLLVPVDPNLETQVRQEAARQLLAEAGSERILPAPRPNAQSTRTRLLLRCVV